MQGFHKKAFELMAMKIFLFLPLAPLVLANLVCSKNRRLMVFESHYAGVTSEQSSKDQENTGKNSVEDDQPDVNSHHSIPRQTYSSWENGQPSPDNGVMSNDKHQR